MLGRRLKRESARREYHQSVFHKAQQLIGQYGSEEGLRRLRETAPDLARQFERLATPKEQLPEQPEPK